MLSSKGLNKMDTKQFTEAVNAVLETCRIPAYIIELADHPQISVCVDGRYAASIEEAILRNGTIEEIVETISYIVGIYGVVYETAWDDARREFEGRLHMKGLPITSLGEI